MTALREAFVFGGGGRWGAVEVGMLRALIEHDVRPDLVLGTSIGALNGSLFASDPTLGGVDRLRGVWDDVRGTGILATSTLSRFRTLIRHRTSLHTTEELAEVLDRYLQVDRFDQLAVAFQCNAACIEDAGEHWFGDGPLARAILASSAIPGMLPPVEIDGRHYYDGGLVNSVPVDRAIALGANRIYVLHVGRIEQPLRPPEKPYEPALIAFEIARRHRLTATLAAVPEEVEVHVLPSGNQLDFDDRRQIRWRDLGDTEELVTNAYEAASRYLEERPR